MQPGATLASQMLAAAQAVAGVLGGQSLSDGLARLPADARAAAQSLSFHTMRHLGMAQAWQACLVTRKPGEPLAHALLLLSLALLDTNLPAAGAAGHDTAPAGPSLGPRYAPHTLVHQAVAAAQQDRRCRPIQGLLNAVLRRVVREHAVLRPALLRRPQARWNHPPWWIDTVRAAWPTHWQALLDAANVPGPMTLRANGRRNTPAQLQAAFAGEGIESRPVGDDGIVLARPRPVQALPGHAQGLWSVQDASAQRAGRLLPLAEGMRVLDACAAPGGKTAHLLERHRLELTAVDHDPARLERVGENLERLGLLDQQPRLLCGDASRPEDWWDGRPYDAILADVPCTGSGVVRRHPDIRWLRRADDLPRTAALQSRILDALWPLLQPGGHLLYVTCSIFPQEGDSQVARFLASHGDARRLPAPGQILPLDPDDGDGFFYALIAKRG